MFFFNIHQDLYGQSASDIASEVCGLITVLSGTTVLHSTREPDPPPNSGTASMFEFGNVKLICENKLLITVIFAFNFSKNKKNIE